jgi:hypothetical protein
MTTKRIAIVTPQFRRSAQDTAPAAPPEDFAALRGFDKTALKEMGCRVWDEPDADGRVLMLFPGEWYQKIPGGFVMEGINGKPKTFRLGETDNDIRFGCLAYGVRVAEESK